MYHQLRSVLPDDKTLSILDIGCGYGFALRALRMSGYTNIMGVEVSEEQAERSRRAGFHVEVCPDTIEWLHKRDNLYSVIILFDVLEHVPVPEQIDFLRAIHRSLRANGRLILTVPNANSVLASRWRYIDYTHHSSFTEHSLFFVLKNAGFDGIEIDNSKGIGRMPRRLWRADTRAAFRRWFVRWCWLQVFAAEIPWERIEDISFDLNLKAVASKC
jgi:SAM-dependent methyltransferase